MEREPNWEWYRTFLGVLESGSLSAAGRNMGLTQPTVGRHIDALEAMLGLRLFIRSSDGFLPTDAALELRPHAASLAAGAAALRRVAGSYGAGVRGSVRLSVSEVIGVEVLPPILAKLRREHPQLVIELVLSNQADDLLKREVDIAVRMFRPTQDALLIRRIGAIEVGMFAHRRYLASCGTPQTMADLQAHSFIGFDQNSAYIRKIVQQFPELAQIRAALRADSNLAQLGAIRAAFGIGVCQTGLAARDRRLVRVLETQFAVRMDTWVAMHGDLRDSPRCAVTFAAIAEGLIHYAAS